MNWRFRPFLLLSFTFLLSQCTRTEQGVGVLPKKVDFNFHIKPLLSDRCFACHGPDEKAREAELSLHLEGGAFSAVDNDGMFVISPGNLQSSELYHRIISDDPDYMMPPPSSNLSLNDYERKLITKWISQGAEWKEHWAFIPPEVQGIPPAKREGWDKNPIDAFVLKKMIDQGLKPAGEEKPELWLRRASFDLTGLPPSPESVDALLESSGEDDYERIVDELLESKQYGEHMASSWLDVARYADSHGYQDDRPRTIWPWRNWVINAFNQNQPYDQFVTQQLAGDMLHDPTYAQKLATAFNRNHAITQEGGVIDEEYLTEYAADRTETFSTAFLAMTMQCARCHDHKYDPITMDEYYGLFGFFNNVEGERGRISYFDLSPSPSIKMEDEDYLRRKETIGKKINEAKNKIGELRKSESLVFEEWNRNESEALYDLKQGLVAHFNLDDKDWHFFDAALQEKKGRANVNLPPKIPLPEKLPGFSGNSLQFDGDNFLTLGEIADFNHYDRFSVSLWVNHKIKPIRDAAIFARRNEEQYRQGYDCTLLTNRKISVRLIHNVFNNKQIEVRTRNRLPSKGWHHLAVTYDGSGEARGVTIFLDGQKQAAEIVKDSLGSLSIDNGNDFLIGHWNHRARVLQDQHGFKGGKIDEVRIYDRRLSQLEVKKIINKSARSTNEELLENYLVNHSTPIKKWENTLDSLRALDTIVPHIMIMQESDTIKPSFVLDRGAYDAKLHRVERNTPARILPFESEEQNRLGLAKWLFEDKNPLTARVMINRLWQQCFGQGIVKTAEDFGNQGDLPSHPELLDWLSIEFKKSGWDIKHMLKLIVLSKTYRQSAAFDDRSYQQDPSNRYLSRGPNRPLSAEMLRDQALYVSNTLYDLVGGKWVKPYQPPGIWKELANQIGENKYRVSPGKSKYRRSLYTYWKRTIPPPTMITLDAPERSVCTVRRQATSTPLQSLILLNDPTYLEASRHLATLLSEEEDDLESQIKRAFRKITTRIPSVLEYEKMKSFFDESKMDFDRDPDEALAILSVGDSPASQFAEPAIGAALTMTVSMIFNLDEARRR